MTGSAAKTEVAAADAALAIPVWDLPVRLFHWALVALIAFSWWSAEWGRTDLHLWSGYGVLFLILFRILWGFLGSSTARFGEFVKGPGKLHSYLRDPGDWRSPGHTPLGAASVVVLLLLVTVQVGLGLLLSDEDGIVFAPLNHLVSIDTAETAAEIHELLFNVLLGFIALHIAAILFYRLFRRRRLLGAMIRGTSRDYPEGTAAMIPAPAWHLMLCVALAGALTAWIIAGAPPS